MLSYNYLCFLTLTSSFILVSIRKYKRYENFYPFSTLLHLIYTLVHCEVNFRASVFGFLYQVIYLGTPSEEAQSLLTSIWIPNETWETFITYVLAEKGFEHPLI